MNIQCYRLSKLKYIFIALAIIFIHIPLANAALVNGGFVSGSILTPGEEDAYTFTANVGENVLIRVADTSNNTFYSEVTLYGPTDNYITFGRNNNVAVLDRQLIAGGTYTVVIYDDSANK